MLQQRQLAQLLCHGQPVAGLHFQRRDAARQDAPVGPLQARQQLVGAGRPAGGDAGPDAPAAGSHLGEGGAAEAFGVLVVALAAEDGMRVALHEARQDRATAGVQRRHAGLSPVGQHVRAGPDGDDAPAAHSHGAVGQEVELAL